MQIVGWWKDSIYVNGPLLIYWAIPEKITSRRAGGGGGGVEDMEFSGVSKK